MTLFAFALLADENINPDVVAGLIVLGCDIVTVGGLGLAGAPDSAILKRAADETRIVITHDPDFGRLCQLRLEQDESRGRFGVLAFEFFQAALLSLDRRADGVRMIVAHASV